MKSKLKYIVAALLVILLIGSLTCCGGSSDDSAKSTSDAKTEASSEASADSAVESNAESEEISESAGEDDARIIRDPSGAVPSEGHEIAVNKETGYSLEYESTDTAEINPKTIIVYTGKEQDIPYYFVAPMLIPDRTTEEYAEYDRSNIAEWYRGRLLEEPKAVEETFGPWKAYGVQYRFLSEDGTQNMWGIHYIVPYADNGWHMSWTAFFQEEDSKTPSDMHHAMETFRLLAN